MNSLNTASSQNSQDTAQGKSQAYNAEAFEALSEVGFLADTIGLYQDSAKIFEALQGMKKSSPYPTVGKAFTLIRMGNFSEASDLLRNSALPLDQNNNDVKSFLALSLHLEGKASERDKVINSIHNPSPSVGKFVETLMAQQA